MLDYLNAAMNKATIATCSKLKSLAMYRTSARANSCLTAHAERPVWAQVIKQANVKSDVPIRTLTC